MTAKDPENQSTAKRRAGVAGGINSRPRTAAQGQRIFVSGDKIVEKPPVLFRMPSVKISAAGAAKEISSPVESQDVESSQSGASISSKPGVASPAISGAARTPFDKPASAPSVAHQGPRAPHFLANPATSNDLPDLPNEAGLVTDKDRSPILQRSENTGSTATAAVIEQDRAIERTPKSQRNAPLPEVAPVPPGRGWMEVLGSRLVIVLAVAAIAAIAILANRESTPRSAAELAILELGNAENGESAQLADKPSAQESRADSRGASLQRSSSNTGRQDTVNDESFAQNSATQSGLTAPVRTAQANPAGIGGSRSSVNSSQSAESSPTVLDSSASNSIEPVQPDFDLSELVGPSNSQAAIEATPTRQNRETFGNGSRADSGSQADSGMSRSSNPPSLSGPTESFAATSPNLTTPSQQNTATTADSHWQKELQQIGESVGATANGSNSVNAAMQPNSESTQRGSFDAGNRFVSEPNVGTMNGGADNEAAIRAAIDAAMLNRNEDRAEKPEVQATSQPAGISDWSKYLPSNNSAYPSQTYPSQPYPGQVGPETYQPNYQQNMMPPGNMIPPGMINTPSGYQSGYPAQTFTNDQTYQTQQNSAYQYNGQEPRTAMLPSAAMQGAAMQSGAMQSGATNNNPQTVNGFTIPPIGYGQSAPGTQPRSVGPSGMQSGTASGQPYPSNQYPSSFADPNRR